VGAAARLAVVDILRRLCEADDPEKSFPAPLGFAERRLLEKEIFYQVIIDIGRLDVPDENDPHHDTAGVHPRMDGRNNNNLFPDTNPLIPVPLTVLLPGVSPSEPPVSHLSSFDHSSSQIFSPDESHMSPPASMPSPTMTGSTSDTMSEMSPPIFSSNATSSSPSSSPPMSIYPTQQSARDDYSNSPTDDHWVSRNSRPLNAVDAAVPSQPSLSSLPSPSEEYKSFPESSSTIDIVEEQTDALRLDTNGSASTFESTSMDIGASEDDGDAGEQAALGRLSSMSLMAAVSAGGKFFDPSGRSSFDPVHC